MNERILTFHDARYACLEQINLKKVLARKNPYLFRAKNVLTAAQLVTGIMDAFCAPAGAIDWPKLVRYNSGNLPGDAETTAPERPPRG